MPTRVFIFGFNRIDQACIKQSQLILIFNNSFMSERSYAQQQNEQGLRRVQRMTEQAMGIAVNTNLECYKNGEKLERITEKVNTINGKLVTAEKSAKEITSFWYYLKTRVKKAFGVGTNNNEEKTQATSEEQNYGKSEGKVEEGALQMTGDEDESVEDRILKNLKQLKQYGKELGKEIDRQTPMINNLEKEMDKADVKMKKVNNILKKELDK